MLQKGNIIIQMLTPNFNTKKIIKIESESITTKLKTTAQNNSNRSQTIYSRMAKVVLKRENCEVI